MNSLKMGIKETESEREKYMKYTKLSGTDVEISQIVLGCWALGGGYTWGDQNDANSIKTVHAALDHGINSFDTAEFYGEGRSEEVLGKALSGKRASACVISKIWVANMDKEGVVKACDGSLKRLNTDYIDLYMIHWPNREVELSETLEAMFKLVSSGKVRAVGVSNFGALDLSDASEMGNISVNQLPYSLLFRAIEDEVLPACRNKKIPVMAYSALAQGLLTGKFNKPSDVDDERARIRLYSNTRPGTVHDESRQEERVFDVLNEIRAICADVNVPMAHAAINWVAGKPGIAAVLVGARTPEQIVDNLGSLEDIIDADTVKKLDEATQQLKQELGPNPDMWRTVSRFR